MTLIRTVDRLAFRYVHAKYALRPDIRDRKINWPWAVSTRNSLCRASILDLPLLLNSESFSFKFVKIMADFLLTF